MVKSGEMPKERRRLSVASNRTRVSPYPLRSSRTQKEREPEASPMQAQGPSQWEDIRCVICMEAPHNAVLLKCSSSSNGCRTYMCDTSARHSNCFKQYRRKNRNRFTRALSCPHCRGEVQEAMKVSGARRYLNAKPRSCAFEGCDFSGTYSQLKTHLKADHPGFTRPLVDPGRQRAWEQVQRNAEYSEIMTAAGLPHRSLEEAALPRSLPPTSVIQVRINGIVQNLFFAASPLVPTRVDIRAIVRRWTPS